MRACLLMSEQRESFWRWYFSARRGSRLDWLPRPLAVVLSLLFPPAVIAWMYHSFKQLPPEQGRLARMIVTNPLILLAYLFLFLSFVNLDYLRYRIQQVEKTTFTRSIEEAAGIPRRYRSIYGTDLFYRANLTLRWGFLALLFLGAVLFLLQSGRP